MVDSSTLVLMNVELIFLSYSNPDFLIYTEYITRENDFDV